VAIVRVEQLFPLPDQQLQAVIDRYSNAEFLWVQEEPENMGAWQYMWYNMASMVQLKGVYRPGSASPATGFKKWHDQQQEELVKKAFQSIS
jgi:2-oxoglutarate dehydrogenase complex dehydrogenase (E1) component-like enzyme